MHADSGRGKGALSLYGAANGGGPALGIRIRRICTTPSHDRDEARAHLTAHLRALGIPRLEADGILTAIRPDIP